MQQNLFLTERGVLFLDDPSSNPTFPRYIYAEDLPNFGTYSSTNQLYGFIEYFVNQE